MAKIGIFGGSFDPIHNQHIAVARHAVKNLELDKLFIIPAANAPHKSGANADASHRLKMLEIAFENDQNIKPDDFELQSGGKSYTYLTVGHFAKKYPGSSLFFIVGLDMLKDFANWKNARQILENCTLAAAGRAQIDRQKKANGGAGVSQKISDGGADTLKYNNNGALYAANGIQGGGQIAQELESFYKTFGKKPVFLGYTGDKTSSTVLRFLIALDRFDLAKKDIPENVAEYIKKHGLYRDEYCEIIKKRMTPKRYAHTVRVAVLALKIRHLFSVTAEEAFYAAVFHDIAKEDMSVTLTPDIPEPVRHAFAGAYILENEFNIANKRIINAVKYHTTGRPQMTNLEKLIFVSDMLEPSRNYYDTQALRKHLFTDGEKCFRDCLQSQYINLKKQKKPIYYLTEEAYRYYFN